MGWKIDYQKLLTYLKEKYKIPKALYFGGVEIHNFKFNFEKHLTEFIKERGDKLSEPMLLLLHRHLQRIRFYLKLQEFGYELHLKPVKLYEQEDGTTKRKANCDFVSLVQAYACTKEYLTQ